MGVGSTGGGEGRESGCEASAFVPCVGLLFAALRRPPRRPASRGGLNDASLPIQTGVDKAASGQWRGDKGVAAVLGGDGVEAWPALRRPREAVAQRDL